MSPDPRIPEELEGEEVKYSPDQSFVQKHRSGLNSTMMEKDDIGNYKTELPQTGANHDKKVINIEASEFDMTAPLHGADATQNVAAMLQNQDDALVNSQETDPRFGSVDRRDLRKGNTSALNVNDHNSIAEEGAEEQKDDE